MRIISLILIWTLANAASAANYFIDNNNGSDANSGLGTSSPWKKCPGMQGFSGSYTYSPGDIFIFKGGVTWTNPEFPLVVTQNSVTFESTSSWYSGSFFTQPIFDMQDQYLSGSYSVFYVQANSITINGFEIRNQLIPNSTSWNAYGVAAVSGYQGTSGLIVENCWIHNWISGCPTNNVNNTDSDFGGVFSQGSNLQVTGCTIGPGLPPTGLTGNCGCGVGGSCITVVSNIILGCTDMIDSSPTNLSFNTFEFGTNSYDPQHHANCLYVLIGTNQTIWINNNILHDLGSTFQTMLIQPYLGCTNTTFYVYNNVAWNLSSPIDFGNAYVAMPGTNQENFGHVYNNTIVNYGTVAAIIGGGPPLTEIDCENNLWISDSTINAFLTASISGAYAPVGTRIDLYNLQMSNSVATAAGYVAANQYATPNSSASTVGAGTNLISLGVYNIDVKKALRPASLPWDIGAYQFGADIFGPVIFPLGNFGRGSFHQ
jgi:hypothetical protein